jgi:CRISPR-associated endonuclease/helicase Cas3
MKDFPSIFRQLTENDPFPWQEELFARFRSGKLERSLDIPTGLGKTAVMAIWLVARGLGAALPRRLVYVVDRRAVVDQATEVAIALRRNLHTNPELKQGLGLGERSLPISTLRGQHIDNKEWLEDPSSPAVIVGTVDMIGSRVLFEGYGTSRKMRPYHAGLLGADSLVVLDEAHLVPPFEKLLEKIADSVTLFGPRDKALQSIIPPFKLVSLSATGRAHAGTPFGLQEADLKHAVVRRRLDGLKRLCIVPLEDGKRLADALAEQAWTLTGNGTMAARIIVFCDKRRDAEDAKTAIEKLAKGDKKQGIGAVDITLPELFVGARRLFEREQVADWLKQHGFIAGSKQRPIRPTFLLATSAGEVGVDLDADHMVSDLVTWERMVQRLGRVNRRGEGDARVIVIVEPEPKPKKSVQDALEKSPANRTDKEIKAIKTHEALVEIARALIKPFDHLLRKDGFLDASTGALRDLKLRAKTDAALQQVLSAATTPAPLRPELSRPLIDAWSMTSLKDHTARPEVQPWLRGWIEDDPPQTYLIWRAHLPVRGGVEGTEKETEAFFEAAPPHVSEALETETFRVIEWLECRAKALLKDPTGSTSKNGSDDAIIPVPRLQRDEVAAIALSSAGDVRAILRLDDLTFESDDKKANERKKGGLERDLADATLVVDARIAGLRDGLLDEKVENVPRTADDGGAWLASAGEEPVVRFRVRAVDADAGQPVPDRRWRQRFRFATELSDNDEPRRWLIVEKWLYDAATEEDRSAGQAQLLDTHQRWAECRARELAQRLGLPHDYTEMLAIAARLHDEGKRAKRWQRAFNALMLPAGVYAKTPGPLNVALLDGYRHEFGSLAVASKNEQLTKLPAHLQDLALHLIAAHHGFARPVTNISGCEDAPPSAVEDRAREVALRFVRLQEQWGAWGLAWWEALLRAADQQASRDNDIADPATRRENG